MNKLPRLVHVLVAGLIVFALAGASPAAAPAVARAQPALLQMAAAQPAARLSVIVQKADMTGQAEKLVAGLGGRVTQDLHIIDAFAAELPASAVVQLSQAPGVRWVSLDAPMAETDGPDGPIDTSKLVNAYEHTVNVDKLWAEGYEGSGVTVAVIDSGVNSAHPDLSQAGQRVVAETMTVPDQSHGNLDTFGHGTHVAGIIGGDGSASGGQYVGIAPKVNLVSVRVSDDMGVATASSVVAGLQWVNDNRKQFSIRVVNLSLASGAQESYNVDPLDAAVEILWFNGVVVVVSSGNDGKNALFSPANDPFVISVGATDDNGTPNLSDDAIATYSGSGITTDGVRKPDLVAPGTHIISLNSADDTVLALAHPDHLVGQSYFKMSGTSMAAPVVSGVAALLLQSDPTLTPAQVKYRLISTANDKPPFNNRARSGAGLVDAYAAVHAKSTKTADSGVAPSELLRSAMAPSILNAVICSGAIWNAVNWNAVNWNAVNWNAVNWNAVNWNAVNWNALNLVYVDGSPVNLNAVNWNAVNWNAVNWNAVNWNAVNWNAVNWNAVNWNAVNWNAVNWNAVNWNAVNWNAVNWNAVNWNAVNWNAVNWNAVNWNAVNWNAVNWNAVNWNAVNWNAVNWNAVNWNAVNWNAVNWNAVNWNAVNWNSDYWDQ